MPNNDDFSDLGDTNAPKPPPRQNDHSDEDETTDSNPAFCYDPSDVTQGFLRSQRDKLLRLLRHSPQEIERIQDLYLTHIVGQFHVIGGNEWDDFWAITDGLYALGKPFCKGSILFGGWQLKRSLLRPPSSLSDQVIAYSALPAEFHPRLSLLAIYGEAVRIEREFTAASRAGDSAKCSRLRGEFQTWARDYHFTFRLHDLSLPPISLDEIKQFTDSERFSDLQDNVEGWIHQHSHIKAYHFLPIDHPSQGWVDFRSFCHAFNFLDKPRKNRLRYYFLIQPPSA